MCGSRIPVKVTLEDVLTSVQLHMCLEVVSILCLEAAALVGTRELVLTRSFVHQPVALQHCPGGKLCLAL